MDVLNAFDMITKRSITKDVCLLHNILGYVRNGRLRVEKNLIALNMKENSWAS